MINGFVGSPVLKQIAKFGGFGGRGEGAVPGIFGDQIQPNLKYSAWCPGSLGIDSSE